MTIRVLGAELITDEAPVLPEFRVPSDTDYLRMGQRFEKLLPHDKHKGTMKVDFLCPGNERGTVKCVMPGCRKEAIVILESSRW